jgi:GxxExxY protein
MTSPHENLGSELTHKVIECGIEVHRALGPGLLESAYEACLDYELRKAGLNVQRQKSLPIKYKDIMVDEGYRIDLLIENRLIIELKAVEKILPVHEAQILTYLKLSEIPLGLILNFNEPVLKNGIRRFALGSSATPALSAVK